MKRLLFLTVLVGCEEPVLTLEVSEPAAAAELLPGGTVELAWTVEGGAAALTIHAEPLDASGESRLVLDEGVDEGPGGFTWSGDDVDGEPLRTQVYDLRFVLRDQGDAPVDEVVRTVALHGVEWLEPAAGEALALTGADLPASLRILTVSHRELELAFLAGEVPLLPRTIPGEFVAFERDIPFDGTDAEGEPLPGGLYPLAIEVRDPDTELAYRVEGGTLDWAP